MPKALSASFDQVPLADLEILNTHTHTHTHTHTRLWKTIHADDDQTLLQEDLQVLFEWADLNNKSFNHDKLEHLPFGPPNNRVYTAPSRTVIRYLTTNGAT